MNLPFQIQNLLSPALNANDLTGGLMSKKPPFSIPGLTNGAPMGGGFNQGMQQGGFMQGMQQPDMYNQGGFQQPQQGQYPQTQQYDPYAQQGQPQYDPYAQQPIQPQYPQQPQQYQQPVDPYAQAQQPYQQPAPAPAPAPALAYQQPVPAPAYQQPAQRPMGTGVQLKKGQKFNLSATNPNGLDLINVGLGWDLGPNGQGYDLDVEAFMLGQGDRIIGDDWFVFYGQENSPDNSVRLLASSTDGSAVGDDEIISVQLSKVNPSVTKIVFIVTINEALQYGYNFGNVSNAYARIVNVATGAEIARFNLTDCNPNVCSMVVGELYKHNNEWKFNPVGDGMREDLAGLCRRYGVNVGD